MDPSLCVTYHLRGYAADCRSFFAGEARRGAVGVRLVWGGELERPRGTQCVGCCGSSTPFSITVQTGHGGRPLLAGSQRAAADRGLLPTHLARCHTTSPSSTDRPV